MNSTTVTTTGLSKNIDVNINNVTLLEEETTSFGHGVLAINYFVSFASCVIFMCDILGIVILGKCKRIPRQCRYLSMSFLLSDALGAAFFFIHQIIIFACGIFNDVARNSRTVVVGIVSIISFASIAALSLERVLSLKANIKYYQKVKVIHTYIIIALVWAFHSCILSCVVVSSYATICNWSFDGCDVWSVTRSVRLLMFGFMVFYDAILVFSNISIHQIAQRHKRQIVSQSACVNQNGAGQSPEHLGKGQNAATHFVMKMITVYLILQAPMTINVLITEYTDNTHSYLFHRIFKTVSYLCIQINSFINISLYIVAFKECKMHIYRLLGKCFKKYNQRAETLRYEVFSIVAYRSSSSRKSRPPIE